MEHITLFEAMFVTHFVMDWIFQSKWEAFQKHEKWFPLMVHCFIYTAGFIPALLFFGVDLMWLALLFVSHIILDKRKLEFWIMKMKGVKKEEAGEPIWTMLVIGIDQTLHILILFLIALWA